MFGISWAEFLVILLVAILVVPVKYWPDVARWLAHVVSYIRKIVWKITDASEQIKNQIDLEKPIDDIINTTTADVLKDFSEPIKKTRRGKKSKKK
jgi:Sec-independent protein translocase protein TatA